MIYDFKKFKSMICYIIGRCQSKDDFDRDILCVMLYFSDFDYYEIFEKPISGETYIRKHIGIVPSHFETLNELFDEWKIDRDCKGVVTYLNYGSSSLIDHDVSSLSLDEIEVIDNVINKLFHFSSEEMIQYSQRDIPLRLAEDGEILDYEAVFYRDPEYSVREYDD